MDEEEKKKKKILCRHKFLPPLNVTLISHLLVRLAAGLAVGMWFSTARPGQRDTPRSPGLLSRPQPARQGESGAAASRAHPAGLGNRIPRPRATPAAGRAVTHETSTTAAWQKPARLGHGATAPPRAPRIRPGRLPAPPTTALGIDRKSVV